MKGSFPAWICVEIGIFGCGFCLFSPGFGNSGQDFEGGGQGREGGKNRDFCPKKLGREKGKGGRRVKNPIPKIG